MTKTFKHLPILMRGGNDIKHLNYSNLSHFISMKKQDCWTFIAYQSQRLYFS